MKIYSVLTKLVAVTLTVLLMAGCTDESETQAEVDVEAAAECSRPEDEVVIRTTSKNVDFVRTPDSCFAALDGYEFSPNYVSIDGLRMHYIDEGPRNGELVLMLHGQPSWSYLYRKMVPVLVEAGYRVIALDHIGMGRSDKPIDPQIHRFEQHVLWFKSFIDELGLREITLFVQDWGSIIGLRTAGDMPDLFSRIVLSNGDLPVIPVGLNPFTVPTFEIDDSMNIDAFEFFTSRSSDRVVGFQQWIDYAASTPELRASEVVEAGTVSTLSSAETAGYEAPFPSLVFKAAIRAFPSMVAGIEDQNAPAWEALGAYTKPFLTLAGSFDPNLGSEETQNKWVAHVPGAAGQNHRRLQAGHFIQEDLGAELAGYVVDFVEGNSAPVDPDEPTTGPQYNFRYCEVLLTETLLSGDVQADVYNSVIFGCPQEQWVLLDSAEIASEFEVEDAILNGPRFWVLDDITNNAPPTGIPTMKLFGGIRMALAATVVLPTGYVAGETSYKINTVSRDTIFHYYAGREVYELQNPEGDRFMMQSFTRRIDEDLMLSELALLGDRLVLPADWMFSVRTLEAPFDLPSVDGIAEVVTDDLGNTYQRIP